MDQAQEGRGRSGFCVGNARLQNLRQLRLASESRGQ